MTTISTLHAAKLVARNEKQDYAKMPMGTLGNLSFKLTGRTQAPRSEGMLGRLGTGLKMLKMMIFSSAAQRAEIREKGMELRAVKRCGHLFGKLTADLTEPENIASVVKTLARMGASIPSGQGTKEVWEAMLEKTLRRVTPNDLYDICKGATAIRDSALKRGGVALPLASINILAHILSTGENMGFVDNTRAGGAVQKVPAVKLTETEPDSAVTPSQPSPLNLSEPVLPPQPIPPRPVGDTSKKDTTPTTDLNTSPPIPPRPVSSAPTPTVKSSDAKPSEEDKQVWSTKRWIKEVKLLRQGEKRLQRIAAEEGTGTKRWKEEVMSLKQAKTRLVQAAAEQGLDLDKLSGVLAADRAREKPTVIARAPKGSEKPARVK
ncbi:hypothetical protein ACOTEY_25870 [Achromobacter xylosoxidans]